MTEHLRVTDLFALEPERIYCPVDSSEQMTFLSEYTSPYRKRGMNLELIYPAYRCDIHDVTITTAEVAQELNTVLIAELVKAGKRPATIERKNQTP